MPHYIKVFNKALPLDLCKRLIEKFERDKNVRPDPQPSYSTRHFLNISVQKNWTDMHLELATYTQNLTHKYFKVPKAFAAITPENLFDDGYVLARYDVGDTCILHYDGQCATPPNNNLRLATQLFYLNTVKKGGETYFPLQKVKIKPQAGKAIMFPPEWTHPHEVLKAGEVRYILQTWITDPDLSVLRTDEVDYGSDSGIIYESET